MTDKEKILLYLNHKGVNKNKFSIQTGLSTRFLDSGSSLGVDKLRIIASNYTDLSLEWLITGQGEMIKTPGITPGINVDERHETMMLEIEELKQDKKMLMGALRDKEELISIIKADSESGKKVG